MTAADLSFDYLDQIIAEDEVKFSVQRHRGGQVGEEISKG
jgi:hypothetical protein